MKTDTAYTAPSFKADSFNCPFCKTFAEQHWGNPNKTVRVKFNSQNINHGADDNFSISCCGSCKRFTVWVDKKLSKRSQVQGSELLFLAGLACRPESIY